VLPPLSSSLLICGDLLNSLSYITCLLSGFALTSVRLLIVYTLTVVKSTLVKEKLSWTQKNISVKGSEALETLKV
jgi:hypothetical protein